MAALLVLTKPQSESRFAMRKMALCGRGLWITHSPVMSLATTDALTCLPLLLTARTKFYDWQVRFRRKSGTRSVQQTERKAA